MLNSIQCKISRDESSWRMLSWIASCHAERILLLDGLKAHISEESIRQKLIARHFALNGNHLCFYICLLEMRYFAKICKQMNGNRWASVQQKGWTLLASCLSIFLPSEEVC